MSVILDLHITHHEPYAVFHLAHHSQYTTRWPAMGYQYLQRRDRGSMKRLFECGVLLRVYTLFMSGLYSYTCLNHPETIMYKVAHSDAMAYWAAWTLSLCAVLGFIDLIVNDLMSDRFSIKRALKDRHLVLMMIPICFAIEMFTAVRYGHPLILLAFYGVYIFMVPASAFTDVNKRYKNKVCP